MEDLKKYVKATKAYPGFKKIDFKWSDGTGNDFPKLKIKIRPELVAFGNPDEIKVDENGVIGGGVHLRPEEVNKLRRSGAYAPLSLARMGCGGAGDYRV